MREAIKSAPRFDEEVSGMPVEAHGWIVTPYARMRGLAHSTESGRAQEGERPSGRYGWAAIRPVRITVQDRSGEVREIRLVDVEGQILRALAIVGALMLVVGLLAPVLNKSRR